MAGYSRDQRIEDVDDVGRPGHDHGALRVELAMEAYFGERLEGVIEEGVGPGRD